MNIPEPELWESASDSDSSLDTPHQPAWLGVLNFTCSHLFGLSFRNRVSFIDPSIHDKDPINQLRTVKLRFFSKLASIERRCGLRTRLVFDWLEYLTLFQLMFVGTAILTTAPHVYRSVYFSYKADHWYLVPFAVLNSLVADRFIDTNIRIMWYVQIGLALLLLPLQAPIFALWVRATFFARRKRDVDVSVLSSFVLNSHTDRTLPPLPDVVSILLATGVTTLFMVILVPFVVVLVAIVLIFPFPLPEFDPLGSMSSAPLRMALPACLMACTVVVGNLSMAPVSFLVSKLSMHRTRSGKRMARAVRLFVFRVLHVNAALAIIAIRAPGCPMQAMAFFLIALGAAHTVGYTCAYLIGPMLLAVISRRRFESAAVYLELSFRHFVLIQLVGLVPAAAPIVAISWALELFVQRTRLCQVAKLPMKCDASLKRHVVFWWNVAGVLGAVSFPGGLLWLLTASTRLGPFSECLVV